MREFTHRQAAVRSIKAIRAMEARCDELCADWRDLDYFFQERFLGLQEDLAELRKEIAETYPGRASAEGER